MLQWDPSVYLGLILVWAGPVLALQWAVGANLATKRTAYWHPYPHVVPVERRPRRGSPRHLSISDVTTGFHLLGLPIEGGNVLLSPTC